jgi:transcriptional regulator with XRE-family HTH domain
MRKRKHMTKEDFLDISGYGLSLDRVESGKQTPRPDTLTDFLTVLNIPANQFFLPHNNEQPPGVYKLCSKLLRMLDYGDANNRPYPTAQDMLNQLEAAGGFDKGFSRQFLLSVKARLFLQLGRATADILPIIYEGIAISFPEFDPATFSGEVLAFQEPELLCCLAKIMAAEGDKAGAVHLLKNVWQGLDKLPISMYEKEHKLSPVLLALALYQLESGDAAGAFEACRVGLDISIVHAEGKYAPFFLFAKARCLYGLGNRVACQQLLQQAFFCFAMIRQEYQLQQVLATAQSLGTPFETLDIADIKFERILLTGYQQGEFVHYNNVGELIGALRQHEGITQEALCQGICSVSKLSRIENGEIAQTNPKSLEALMERLGRSDELYLDMFLSAEDFENERTESEIRDFIRLGQMEQALKLLEGLAGKKAYEAGLNLQFLLSTRAFLMEPGPGRPGEDEDLLYKALAITRPNYDEAEISRYRLTLTEIAYRWFGPALRKPRRYSQGAVFVGAAAGQH